MRGRLFYLSPGLLVLVLLPLVGLGVSFEEAARSRRDALLATRSMYSVALQVTRTQLSSLLSRVTGDSTLVQNLNWQLAHSVAGALTGKLVRTGLDQISLFDKNCVELGHASTEHYQSPPCNVAKALLAKPPSGTQTDGFYWVASESGKPRLALARRIGGLETSETVAVGVVELDANWLALHPELAERLQALALSIGLSQDVVIAENGVDAAGVARASLTSTRLLDKFLLSRRGEELSGGSPLLWPSLALAFFFAALALWQERARQIRRLEKFREFTAWCRGLTKGSEFALPELAQVVATGNALVDLPVAEQLIDHALKLKSDNVHGLMQKRQALETQLKAKEDELQRQCQRLAELAELDSLAVQLQRTSTSFLAQMDEFHARAETVSDIIGSGLASQSASLQHVLLSWQQGVAERGARKFLRSLAETAGSTEGRTELDEQLGLLADLAGSVSSMSINAAQLTAKLVATSSYAARLASHWHALALKSHEAASCSSLPELAQASEAAQALVHIEANFLPVKFSNVFPNSTDFPVPELPRPIWVSALYHIYLATAQLALDLRDGQGEARVAGRMRRDGDKILYVVQVIAETASQKPSAPANSPRRSERQAYHMDIARAMVAPFQVTVAALPAIDGPYPIVISWSAREPYRRSATLANAVPEKWQLAEATFPGP